MEKVANTNGTAKAVDKKNDAEFKAKKAEAAKKCAERKKERAAQLVEKAKWLVAQAEAKKINLPAEEIDFWKSIANPVARTAVTGGQSFLNKVFGDSPKVGQSITLLEFMKKTMKAKAEFDRQIKKLAEKGIEIEFKQAANMLESTYTIKKLA